MKKRIDFVTNSSSSDYYICKKAPDASDPVNSLFRAVRDIYREYRDEVVRVYNEARKEYPDPDELPDDLSLCGAYDDCSFNF